MSEKKTSRQIKTSQSKNNESNVKPVSLPNEPRHPPQQLQFKDQIISHMGRRRFQKYTNNDHVFNLQNLSLKIYYLACTSYLYRSLIKQTKRKYFQGMCRRGWINCYYFQNTHYNTLCGYGLRTQTDCLEDHLLVQ